jgi:hypothetical protein
VVDDDLPPADVTLNRNWSYRSIAPDVRGDTSATVVFAAISSSGSNIGDWASFGSPAVVAAERGRCNERPSARG